MSANHSRVYAPFNLIAASQADFTETTARTSRILICTGNRDAPEMKIAPETSAVELEKSPSNPNWLKSSASVTPNPSPSHPTHPGLDRRGCGWCKPKCDQAKCRRFGKSAEVDSCLMNHVLSGCRAISTCTTSFVCCSLDSTRQLKPKQEPWPLFAPANRTSPFVPLAGRLS